MRELFHLQFFWNFNMSYKNKDRVKYIEATRIGRCKEIKDHANRMAQNIYMNKVSCAALGCLKLLR